MTATEYSRLRRAKHRALGMCIDCPLTADKRAYKGGRCKECYERSVARVLHARTTEEGYRAYRAISRKSMYGITQKEYDDLMQKQQGLCAICVQPETARAWGKVCLLGVDHDHRTGAVRGLLCSACNRAIGLFRDDTVSLARAIVYLENNGI